MRPPKKPGDTKKVPTLDLTGKVLRKRQPQAGTANPYDSNKSVTAPQGPIEIFRRHLPDDVNRKPREREARMKFEIVDDSRDAKKKTGYNPYEN
jgi:hypothetical protein